MLKVVYDRRLRNNVEVMTSCMNFTPSAFLLSTGLKNQILKTSQHYLEYCINTVTKEQQRRTLLITFSTIVTQDHYPLSPNTNRFWSGRGIITNLHIYIDAARGTFCVSTRQVIELDLSQLPTCNHHREATRKGWGRRAGQRPTYHLTRGLQVGVQFRRDTPNRLTGGSFSRRISVEIRNNFTLFIWVETILCSGI